jgi:hypothetical protein
MPVVSNAQRRFMYATQAGKTDVSPKVGADFISKSHGITGLPEYVHEGHPELTKLASHKSSRSVDDVIQAALRRNK